MERGLQITEEVLRHLVTRVERPSKAVRPDGSDEDDRATTRTCRPPRTRTRTTTITERIDESESEAAPAAID